MDTRLYAAPLPEAPLTARATHLPAPGGWVLDTGALLDFADATAYAASVRAMAARTGRTLLVPLPALAAAALRRGAAAAARLAGLLADPSVLAVDGSIATGATFERLVDRAAGDRIAALVVLLGTDRGWPVLTDRGEALRRIRPDLMTIPS